MPPIPPSLELISGFLIILFSLIVFLQPTYFIRLSDWICKRTPPGPFSLPFYGATGISPTAPWKTLAEWGDKNGGLCSLFLGSEFTIVLTGKEAIKEAMVNPAFDGRPLNMASRKILKEPGLGYGDGPVWTETRRFCVSTLRHLGGHPGSVEQDENLRFATSELIAYIRSQNGVPFDCRETFDRAVTIASMKFIQDGVVNVHNPEFHTFVQALKDIFVMSENTGVLNILPFLKHVPPFKRTQDLLEKALGYVCQITQENIKRRRAEGVTGVTNDILDAVLQQQAKEDPNSTNFTDRQIVVLMAEFLFAAIEDIIVTFMWIMVALLKYPEIQKKCQELVDQVVGRDRPPSLKDRPKLGYLEAVIWEALRFSNAVPFPFPRRIMQTINFRGYILPKDSVVITNAYAVGFNKDYWEDPEVFRPERFLSPEGKFVQSSLILAFGAGRRVCVGMAYAQMQLLMFLAGISQNFTLRTADGKDAPSFESFSYGIMLTPNDFDLVAEPR